MCLVLFLLLLSFVLFFVCLFFVIVVFFVVVFCYCFFGGGGGGTRYFRGKTNYPNLSNSYVIIQIQVKYIPRSRFCIIN